MNETRPRYAVIIAYYAFWFLDPLAMEIFISRTGETDLPVFMDKVFEWNTPLLECQKEQISWIYKNEYGKYPEKKWLDQLSYRGKP